MTLETLIRVARATALFTFLTPLFWSLPSYAGKTKATKYLMVALGDSITAGFLADTRLANYKEYGVPAGSTVDEVKNWIKQRSMLDHKTTYSWASGRNVPSQFVLMNDFLKVNEPDSSLDVLNLAVSGATSSDLRFQVPQVLKAMHSGQYDRLKYVVLLIGANDSCHLVSAEAFRQNLLWVFSKLSEVHQLEKIRVLVSGFPRIPDLGAPSFKKAHTIAGLTCAFLQDKILRACVPLTTWKTQNEYNEKMQYVTRMNEQIVQVVNEINSRYPQLDVVFSDAPFVHTLGHTDLAIDCFHPNYEAQGRLSEMLWAAQPWYH